MPFVKVITNLARNQLPAKFLPNFCFKLAEILDKDPAKINWILETDKYMSMVRIVSFCVGHLYRGK